jgi:hypothetical protein
VWYFLWSRKCFLCLLAETCLESDPSVLLLHVHTLDEFQEDATWQAWNERWMMHILFTSGIKSYIPLTAKNVAWEGLVDPALWLPAERAPNHARRIVSTARIGVANSYGPRKQHAVEKRAASWKRVTNYYLLFCDVPPFLYECKVESTRCCLLSSKTTHALAFPNTAILRIPIAGSVC